MRFGLISISSAWVDPRVDVAVEGLRTLVLEREAENDRAFRQHLKKAGVAPGSSSAKDGRFWQGLKLQS